MIPPPTWTPTNREYHEAPGVSSSMLRDFINSPRYYHWRYVLGNEDPKTSRPMRIGHIVATIFDGRQRSLVVPEYQGKPVEGRNTKAFSHAYNTATDPDNVVTAGELEQAEAIADAIMNPKTKSAAFARDMLIASHGYSEYAVRDVGLRGVQCRAMVDRLYLTANNRKPIGYCELKTTAIHPSQWTRKLPSHIAEMGYDIRIAFSSSVLAGAMNVGYTYITQVITFVHQSPPHEVINIPVDAWCAAALEPALVELERLRLCMEDEGLFALDFEREPTTKVEVPPWRLDKLEWEYV